MKRIVKIQNVGNVAFPEHMSDAEIAQAAAKLHARASRTARGSVTRPNIEKEHWQPSEQDPVLHIKSSSGHEFHLHAEDPEEAKKRDPGLKILPR